MTNLSQTERSHWIELEDTFLTNTPRGTDKPATEFWLFTWDCKRLKRGVRRKRCIQTLKGSGPEELRQKLEAFCERPDVVLIEDSKPCQKR